MKIKKISLAIAAIFLCICTYAQDFYVEINDGIRMRFTILDTTQKTVGLIGSYEVDGAGNEDNNPVINLATTGTITIPSVIYYNNTNYQVTEIGEYAFDACNKITSVTIPNSVTSIGRAAFFGCSGLTSVTIPNSVTSIGNRAFYNCSGLTSVTIPNSVTSIGNYAFSGCSGLTSVTIPNSVTSIGDYAFSGCSGLTSMKVASGNPVYDSRDNCNAIIRTATNTLISGCKSTVIPNSVTSIGNSAFYGCSGLTSVTIPNSVTSIENYAFYGCSGLTSLTIGSSVTSIGHFAFSGCSGLTSLTIGSSVTSIGTWAFEDCSGLTSLTIPNSVTSIGSNAFLDCSGLTSVVAEMETPVSNIPYYEGYGTYFEGFFNNIGSSCVLTVPAGTRDAYIAAGWTENVFKGGIVEALAPGQNIDFADANVKALCVANWDTNGDGELSETEAAAVTNLGTVFKGKTIHTFDELQYFTGLTSIGDYAFTNCSGLTSVTIPNSVTSIGERAFFRCSGLTSVTIGSSVTSIGSNAFNGCSGLTSVIIPESVTSIGEGAFSSCSGLTSVIIPESVTSIGVAAFSGCSGLTSVTIGSSVTSIGSNAFNGCSGLTSVIIPESVTSIGSNAFYNCAGLAYITVEIGNTIYDSRDNCNAIIETATNTLISGCKSTVIPNSVTSIGVAAFFHCSGLTSVTIPNSVTSIGVAAFSGCSGLTSVTIGSSVTSIGSNAFYGCSGLTSVVAEMETPFAFGDYAFSSIGSSCTLTVPAGTRDAYIAAGWTEDVFKGGVVEASKNIDFADANVKALCVANWDTNGDGELSEAEAAAVTDLGEVFQGNTTIQTFDELQYFTGLTSIGYIAFESCSGLTSVTIPNSVTSIGYRAFAGCNSLNYINIPSSVTSIERQAFAACNAIQQMVVEDNNPVYDSRNGCNAIIETSSNTLISGTVTSIIPESVKSIGNSAFLCISLSSITIPNGVMRIGEGAFNGCSSLTSVTIPESVISIGDYAFGGSGLTSVTIPSSVTEIGENPFNYCTSLQQIIVNPNNHVYDSREECNAIIKTSSNTLIIGCQNTTISNSVANIGNFAFWGCSDLTSITIPESVTSIGDYAFGDCSGLTSVVTEMETPFAFGSDAFENIGSSCVLTVPYGTRDAYIAAGWTEDVFKGGIIEAPAPIPNIDFADANVKALCVANWDTNGDGELSETEAAAVTDLGEVFKGNTTIQTFDELQYFTGLTRIRWEAFAACNSLTSVIIPNSVTVLGDRAFSGSALEDVALPSSVTEIRQGAFMNCGKLKSINLPEGVQVITLSSFQNTPALKSITLPDGITSIEHHAFTMSGIEAINLPEGLTSIGECAFQACNSLASVVSLVQSPATIVKNVFMGIGPDCVLTIPQVTCYEDYVAKGWTPELFARIEPSYIIFADNAVKAICLQNWDADHDGMLTFAEAAAVTDLGNVFAGNTQIVTFNELKYFTGLSTLSADAFRGCSALTSITVPADLPSYGTLSFKGCTSLAEINIGTDRNVHNLGFVNKAQGWSDEGTVDCFCSEFWNKAFDTHQTLLVPNGTYCIKFKAFQRPADYTTSYNDYAAGNWESFAVVYANDTEKALKHICDGMQEQRLHGSDVAVGNSYIPNSMWTARIYFDAGLYADELEVEVTDGTLTFGVRGDYKQYSQWAIFSDFELSLKKVLATGIALNSESVTMTGTGETYSLYATVSPTDVTEKSVTWSSSDESVATVSSEGVVTAVANGTAIITATTNDGSNLSATCTVTNEIIPMSEWTKENTFNYNIQLVKASQNDHTYTETCQVDLEQVRSAVGEGKIKLYTRKDDSDSPYTRGYTCTPYPGFWMDEQGEYPVEYRSTTSYGMTFNETSGVITFYSKPWVDMVGNQYTSSFYLVNETNGKYVELNLNVSIIAEEPAVEPDTDISGLDNVIYIEAKSVYVGDEVTLDVKMKNTLIPVGCSFRLTLPNGFTLKRDEYDDVDYILGSRANKMSINLSETSDASYNVALTPTSGTATIRGNEDTVVSFTLQVSDEAVAGTYPVRLTRSLIQSKVDGTTYDTSLSDVYVTFTVEDCLLGDVNGDGNITPSDAIMILYHYFEVGQNGFNVKAADVNGDGSITPADAIEVLYIYFNDSSGSKSRQTDFQELDPQ